MRLRLVLPVVLAVAGCSLPLPSGVHSVGEVTTQQRLAGPLQVIPPGPQSGDSPTDTVLGFLGAQADADGSHAIARRFLTPSFGRLWHDDTGVLVYDPDRLGVRQVPTASPDRAIVRVSSLVLGEVRSDGSYAVGSGARASEDYLLERTGGRWAIANAPEGLRLTAADRERSFTPEAVYFLAPQLAGLAPHLVPDRVFVPAGADTATSVVEHLLAGPSRGLAGSVRTAVPPHWRLRQPVRVSGSGVADVELSGAGAPSGAAAQDLAAQLVWTLRDAVGSLRSVQVTVDGTPLPAAGSAGALAVDAFQSYDADPLGAIPPYYFVSQRSPRVSVDDTPGHTRDRGVVAGASFPVDALAVTPDRSRAALLQAEDKGEDTLRIGALGGTSFPVVDREAALGPVSWGSAELGLWLVRAQREVLLVPRGTTSLARVQVRGLPPGPVQSLAVSRDDARIALVVGGGLYVGRIEVHNGAPLVTDLVAVLPALHRATAVAWSTSTELYALGVLAGTQHLVRVAADGSTVATLNTAGLTPTAVAAAPGAVLVCSEGHLFLSTGGPFRQVQGDASSAPAYPG